MSEGAAAHGALPLPRGYRPAFALAYHGRDRASVSERVTERRIEKPILASGVPALLVIDLSAAEEDMPVARWRLDRPADEAALRQIGRIVPRMLGLQSDAEAFEALPGVARLVGERRGLRIPLTADPFEAVCWAIIGQQINLSFAAALRRAVIEKAGTLDEASGLMVHPDAASIASLDPADLAALRFSRSKARYLVEAASRIAGGGLVLDKLAEAPPEEAEAALSALHGIGPWTARYIQLRGFGSPDIAPIGDSGLATGLQRWLGLDTRPDAKAQEASMRAFAPHRSLATAHFWASLGEAQG